MKKIIFRAMIFIIPFALLHFLNVIIYKQDQGDLVRIGYLYSNPCPIEVVKKQYTPINKNYTRISDLNLDDNKKKKYDVFTIGDSFAEQDNLGYKSFLAKKGLSVLHTDRHISGLNPIQRLIELINGGFFENITPKYIILQSIEREFIERCEAIDFRKSYTIDSIKIQIKSHVIKQKEDKVNFFSNTTIKIPLTNIEYLFSSKPTYSKTFKFDATSNQLFTNNPRDLLFYQNDIINLSDKNDSLKISQSNEILNRISDLLSKKNIKLIVLISPDKYDIYYPYIKNKTKVKEPLFFQKLRKTTKRYKSVPSLRLLRKEASKSKDIYFYDDTHWSPKGAMIISDEIYSIIKD